MGNPTDLYKKNFRLDCKQRLFSQLGRFPYRSLSLRTQFAAYFQKKVVLYFKRKVEERLWLCTTTTLLTFFKRALKLKLSVTLKYFLQPKRKAFLVPSLRITKLDTHQQILVRFPESPSQIYHNWFPNT